MIILSDACPIIFLSKIEKLDLVFELFQENLTIPEMVVDELLVPSLTAADELYLKEFLKICRIVKTHHGIDNDLKSLSHVDNCILYHEIGEKADLVLSDDKMLRRALNTKQISTLGTLGVLIKSFQKSIIDLKETKSLIDQLIKNHNFRISIELYERVCEILNKK